MGRPLRDQLWEAITTHRELLDDARAKLASALGGDRSTLSSSSSRRRDVPSPGGITPTPIRGATAQAARLLLQRLWLPATTYAYAYVSTTKNGVTDTRSQSDPSGPGANVSSYAS